MRFLKEVKYILEPRTRGYYRTLFYRDLPKSFIGKILILLFVILRNFLSYVTLPLDFRGRKRIIIASDKSVKDFDEALIYVYFGSMYKLVEIEIPQSSVCVDVGAHYGFWTLKMADNCRLIVALEPAPNNFAVLYNSIKSSKVKNVIALPLAAGETFRRSFIVKREGEYDEMYHISNVTIDVRESYPVRVVPLDKLLDFLFIKQVDVIKIDVEGSELDVLRGLKSRLSKRLVNFIVLEVHSSSLLNECIKMLKMFGYEVKVFRITRNLYQMYAMIRESRCVGE